MSSIASSAMGALASSGEYSSGNYNVDGSCEVRNFGIDHKGLMVTGTLASGALSGGAAAALSKGYFWDGAVTGLMVAGANHLLHDAFAGGTQQPPKGKRAPTLEEANEFYRKNKNPNAIYEVDASTVDLNFVDTTGWEPNSKHTVNTLFNSRHGRVFGKLDLIYKGNNQVQILSNRYDFDIQQVGCGGPCCLISNPSLVGRNIATWIGDLNAGNGTPFTFKFSGLNTINRTLSVTNTYHQNSHGFRF